MKKLLCLFAALSCLCSAHAALWNNVFTSQSSANAVNANQFGVSGGKLSLINGVATTNLTDVATITGNSVVALTGMTTPTIDAGTISLGTPSDGILKVTANSVGAVTIGTGLSFDGTTLSASGVGGGFPVTDALGNYIAITNTPGTIAFGISNTPAPRGIYMVGAAFGGANMRLGVNTTNPAANVDIPGTLYVGTIVATNGGGSGSEIWTSNAQARVRLTLSNAPAATFVGVAGGSATYMFVNSNYVMDLQPTYTFNVNGSAQINGTGSGTNLTGLTVASSGNVGIGTVNPAANLDVPGTAYLGTVIATNLSVTNFTARYMQIVMTNIDLVITPGILGSNETPATVGAHKAGPLIGSSGNAYLSTPGHSTNLTFGWYPKPSASTTVPLGSYFLAVKQGGANWADTGVSIAQDGTTTVSGLTTPTSVTLGSTAGFGLLFNSGSRVFSPANGLIEMTRTASAQGLDGLLWGAGSTAATLDQSTNWPSLYSRATNTINGIVGLEVREGTNKVSGVWGGMYGGGFIVKSNNFTAERIAASMTNGDFGVFTISNGLYRAGMSNNVMIWALLGP